MFVMRKMLSLALAAGMVFLAAGCGGGEVEKAVRFQVMGPGGEQLQTLEDSAETEALLGRLLEQEPVEETCSSGELLGTLVMEQQETLKLGQDPDDRGWVEIIRVQVGEDTCRIEMLPGGEGESLLEWTALPDPKDEETLRALWDR